MTCTPRKCLSQMICPSALLVLFVLQINVSYAQKKLIKPEVKKEKSEYIRLSALVFLRNLNTSFIESHFNFNIHQTIDLPNGAPTVGLLAAIDFNRHCYEMFFSTKSFQQKVNNLRPQVNFTSFGFNYGYYFNRNKMGTSKFLVGPDLLFYSYNVKDPSAPGNYQFFIAQEFGAYFNLGYEFLFNFKSRTNRLIPLLGIRIQYEHPLVGNNWGLRRRPGKLDLPGIFEIGLNCGFVK